MCILITCINVGDRWLRRLHHHSAVVRLLTDFGADYYHNGHENDESHHTTDCNPGNSARGTASVTQIGLYVQ
jgi:hypothetical protein